MKCKQCGGDFPNLNALTQHKKSCGKEKTKVGPVEMNIDDVFFEGITVFDKEAKPIPNKPPEGSFKEPFLIPLSLCPEEMKYLALGHTVGLRLEGKYTAEGLIVQGVKLVR